MIVEQISIENTTDNRLHEVISCCLEKYDKEYDIILNEAKELMINVNRHAPDGHARSDEEILVKCFGGLVAEFFVLKQLNDLFKKNKYKNIIAKKTVYNRNEDMDQIDIIVENTNNGKSKKIEVRSSYILKKDNSQVYNRDASLVGYYVTENKTREIKKDYYVTVLFRNIWIKLSDKVEKEIENEGLNTKIIKYMKKRIDNKYKINLHISGAASLKFLEENGTQDNLENNGANYKIIKPIINAQSLMDIIPKIYNELQ